MSYIFPMAQAFVVETEGFTGPLDLLLQLIEKRKLFIGDVSLATVADDFLQHLKEHSSFPVGTVAHFLVIASTLLLIKSRSLLPYLKLTEEETQDIADLERRLELYKQIRDLGQHIQERFAQNMLFTKSRSAPVEPTFAPHEQINQKNILHAAQNLIATLPQVDNLKHIDVEKVMTLEDMIDTLTTRIQEGMETSFKKFSETEGNSKEKRLNVIISFLAVLELVKEGVVLVKQDYSFDDIAIAKS